MKSLKLSRYFSQYLGAGMTLALYVFILVTIIFPNGSKTLMGVTNLPLNATPEEIRKAWGPGDAGSLLEVALTWSRLEHLDPTTQFWIVHLWAPGLAILEVPLIWMSNLLKIPLFWSLTLVTICALIGAFLIFKKITQSSLEKFIFGVIVVTLLLSWDFTYILRDGVFYTEGIGYSLLLSGLGLLSLNVIRLENERHKQWVFPGILVGISVWVRHVTDTALITLTILASAILFILSLQQRKRLKSVTKSQKKLKIHKSKKSIKLILATSIIAIAVTIPWRMVSQTVFDGDPLVMSSASAGLGGGFWVDENKDPDFYWIPYNMNWACNIDQIKCNAINDPTSTLSNRKKTLEAVKSAIGNPVGYLKERGSFLGQTWVPGFNSKAGMVWKVTATLPIFMSLMIVYFIFRIRDKRKWYLLIIWLPFMAILGGQLLIIHFESRYFIPLRLLTVGLFISLLNLFFIENINYQTKFELFRKWAKALLAKITRVLESGRHES